MSDELGSYERMTDQEKRDFMWRLQHPVSIQGMPAEKPVPPAPRGLKDLKRCPYCHGADIIRNDIDGATWPWRCVPCDEPFHNPIILRAENAAPPTQPPSAPGDEERRAFEVAIPIQDWEQFTNNYLLGRKMLEGKS